MKKFSVLLWCVLAALTVTGCAGGENASEVQESYSQAEISSESETSSSQEDSATAAALELVQEANCDVPDFLTPEQQTLYRKAQTAYNQFTLYTDGFGSTEYTPVEVEEYFGVFCVGNGSITTWSDFETAMLGLFTPEYLNELNYYDTTLDNGTTYHYAHFVDYQGRLAFTDGARGSNPLRLPPDRFELISETEDEIRFYVIGTYQDYVENDAGKLVQEGGVTEEKKEIVLTRTDAGWRFSKFAVTY